MSAPGPKATGVLVVRAWLEDRRNGALRARITWTADVSQRDVTRVIVAGEEEIRREVQTWLDALVGGDDSVTGR
jgi:hypothetical protein